MGSFSAMELMVRSPRTINLNRETFGIWRWQMTNHLKYMGAAFLTEPFSKMAVPDGETDDQRKIRQADYEEKDASVMSLLSTCLSDSPALILVTGTTEFHEAWNLLTSEYSLNKADALKQMHNLRMKKGESPIDVRQKLLQILSCVEDPNWSPGETFLVQMYLIAVDDPKYNELKEIWNNLPDDHQTMKTLVRMFKNFMDDEENASSAALKRRP